MQYWIEEKRCTQRPVPPTVIAFSSRFISKEFMVLSSSSILYVLPEVLLIAFMNML